MSSRRRRCPDPNQFQLHDKVQLRHFKGIQGTYFNGTEGRITGPFDEDAGTWPLYIDRGDYRLNVKPQNLIAMKLVKEAERQRFQRKYQREYDVLLSAIKVGLPENMVLASDAKKICEILRSYSTGLVVECSNFANCRQEIYFNLKHDFHRNIDWGFDSVYRYSIDPSTKKRADISYCCVDGEYHRIFCAHCTKHQISECQSLHCQKTGEEKRVCCLYGHIRVSIDYILCKLHSV